MYVSTFKAVEAGTCSYLHVPACTTFKAVEADTCTYLGLFWYRHVPSYLTVKLRRWDVTSKCVQFENRLESIEH